MLCLAYDVLRKGITLHANSSLGWRYKIDSILKGILKAVAYGTNIPSDNLFPFLHLPRFAALFERCVIKKHYWNSPFKILRTTQRSLRDSEHFAIPRVYTKYGKRKRSFYVPDIFNKLTAPLRDINSKRQLKKFLSTKC